MQFFSQTDFKLESDSIELTEKRKLKTVFTKISQDFCNTPVNTTFLFLDLLEVFRRLTSVQGNTMVFLKTGHSSLNAGFPLGKQNSIFP